MDKANHTLTYDGEKLEMAYYSTFRYLSKIRYIHMMKYYEAIKSVFPKK